jgi:hypothetical protein
MNVRGRGSVLLLPLLWLAVVVVVAGLTWRVIDSAGRDVLTSGAPSPLPAAGTTPQADGGSSAVEPQDATGPSSDSTPRSTWSAGSTATPEAPTPHPPPDQPETQVRSWQGSAGTVTTACRGAAISLQSVTPNDGWQVEVDDRGPGRVRVELTSRGDDEQETRVEAACSGGVPRFEVRTDD